jgi:hypothetical protein
MAPPAMRRLIACLFVTFALGGGLPLPASQAQAPPAVTMRVVSQSPWNDGTHPLVLSVRATNESEETLDSLKVVLIIHAPARSRSLYELSLAGDATSVLLAYPFAQEGALEPGQTRTFKVSQALEVLQALGETAIYPLTVELTSVDTPVGTLRSPLIFLAERPEVPLNLAWTWVLSAPIQYRPDGVFLPGPLEADIAPGGRLDTLVQAIERTRRTRLDLVMSAALADQLDRMASGYRILELGGTIRTVDRGIGGAADAAGLLSRLRELAARTGVELVAYPLGDPRLPPLVEAGLAGDLPGLFEGGHSLVQSVMRSEPVAGVVRPPLSQLDALSMAELQDLGASTLLLDPYFLPPPEDLMFSPPALVRVDSGTTTMLAITPDPAVESVATTFKSDPVLGAHAALGELAATWLELPGTRGRGAAVLFPETPTWPVAELQRFASLVRSSPWLRPVKASRFVDLVRTQGEARPLPARRYPLMSRDYLIRLFRAKSSLRQFDRTAVDARRLVEDLRGHLLLAEGGTFVSEPLQGRAFIESVESQIDGIYSGVTIETGRFTLASQRGTIPITVSNRSGFQMRVLLKFDADRRLQFAGGDTQRITLPPITQTLTFAVRAQTTGRIPFTIRLIPSGSSNGDTIAEATMVIRSTSYNRVALILTVGAALFLIFWWGRRLLPRRKGADPPSRQGS